MPINPAAQVEVVFVPDIEDKMIADLADRQQSTTAPSAVQRLIAQAQVLLMAAQALAETEE